PCCHEAQVHRQFFFEIGVGYEPGHDQQRDHDQKQYSDNHFDYFMIFHFQLMLSHLSELSDPTLIVAVEMRIEVTQGISKNYLGRVNFPKIRKQIQKEEKVQQTLRNEEENALQMSC
ncbi:MAG: hypothetical protein MR009_00145, partial [Sutterellaceae bacterium]|nr:hypothetical protein [Sutterellaceae bacterium]